MSSFFLLRDEPRRESCISYLKFVNITHKLLSVNIGPYKKNRSNAQNRTLWSWYNVLSEDTGYTAEQLHEQFKVRFLGVDRRTVDGIELVVPKTSKTLTTQEFSEFMKAVELVAIEMGVTLPYPDDYRFAMGQGDDTSPVIPARGDLKITGSIQEGI